MIYNESKWTDMLLDLQRPLAVASPNGCRATANIPPNLNVHQRTRFLLMAKNPAFKTVIAKRGLQSTQPKDFLKGLLGLASLDPASLSSRYEQSTLDSCR
jgi:hypothetical protein